MEAFAAALITIATGAWVGAIIFQSSVVAPSVFVELDSAGARRFLRASFPRFYRFGFLCGSVIATALVIIATSTGWSAKLALLAAAAVLMLALDVVALWLVPRINSARDSGQSGAARFNMLHRMSVALTVAILLLGVAILGLIGADSALVARS